MANQSNTKKKSDGRSYITLVGDGTGRAVCPDEYFEEDEVTLENDFEDDPDNIFADEIERAQKIDRRISEFCFVSLVVVAASAAIGLFVLLYRVIKFPFIKKFADDYDW